MTIEFTGINGEEVIHKSLDVDLPTGYEWTLDGTIEEELQDD